MSTDTGSAAARSMHNRQGSAPMGLPEMIARGLLERGESLGINKTVMNAVSELKVRSIACFVLHISYRGMIS